MNRIFLSLLLVVVWAFSGTAQTKTAQSVAPGEKEQSLLWEISGKELQTPSYLFGTIHMINKEDFVLTEATRESLAKAKRITFEIDMEDMMDISSLMPLMMNMYMADGKTLKDLLTEEEYQLVNDHFSELGLPLSFLERIKPMFLSMLGGEDLFSKQADGSEENAGVVSYEFELMDLAKKQEIDIAGLETAEFQMSMFDSIPYEAQAKMLLASIESGGEEEDGNSQIDEMVRLYKAQDIEGMQKLMKEDTEGIGQWEELLLVKRNENWIPIMETMMTEGVTFFAVGAGHLGGEKGVVALLRSAGYKLAPIF